MFVLHNEHILPTQILPWLRMDAQPVKGRSITLAVAFPEQVYQVASTVLKPTFSRQG